MKRLHKREPTRARDPDPVTEDEGAALDGRLGLKISDKVALCELAGGFQRGLDIAQQLRVRKVRP